MISFIHILLATLLTATFKDWWLLAGYLWLLIPVIALLSHYILDIIPHRNFNPEPIAALIKKSLPQNYSQAALGLLDFFLGLGLAFILAYFLQIPYLLLIITIIFSCLPDFIGLGTGMIYGPDHKGLWGKTHNLVHYHKNIQINFWLWLIAQIALGLTILFLILIKIGI